ncbi:hypothetical protein Nepgr_023043 [Nepenthes gracilis]|uniref:Uncharacterized protein n=1 Tax=Nepenthes gracilis TaxID=150966 RepID=A0AAD3T3M0_NEPGR|nr:hypothetical protein Nepgr_023043 [Nepenthes gracilis]
MPADAPGTSNGVDVAGCEAGVLPRVSVPPEIMETGLGPNLTAASLLSVSERSENSVDAESVPEVGIPRVASCPALVQLCNQQIDLTYMPSAECQSAGIKSLAPPAESMPLLSPRSSDDQACLDAASLLLASDSAGVCWRPVAQVLISLLSWSLFLMGHAAGSLVLRCWDAWKLVILADENPMWMLISHESGVNCEWQLLLMMDLMETLNFGPLLLGATFDAVAFDGGGCFGMSCKCRVELMASCCFFPWSLNCGWLIVADAVWCTVGW